MWWLIKRGVVVSKESFVAHKRYGGSSGRDVVARWRIVVIQK